MPSKINALLFLFNSVLNFIPYVLLFTLKAVGCDFGLNSDLTEDFCGVCCILFKFRR